MAGKKGARGNWSGRQADIIQQGLHDSDLGRESIEVLYPHYYPGLHGSGPMNSEPVGAGQPRECGEWSTAAAHGGGRPGTARPSFDQLSRKSVIGT